MMLKKAYQMENSHLNKESILQQNVRVEPATIEDLPKLVQLVEELMKNVKIPPSLRTLGKHIRATVHEDNTSCLSLANDQRITSRTRHYHVRWHFFWHHVNQGNVEVVYVETNKQDADYLTKSLPVEPFLANRKRVQGW